MKTGKLKIGSFSLTRKKKRGVFEGRWYVQFKLPRLFRKIESSKLPICKRCQGFERPLHDNAKCTCQSEVRNWAAVRLDELALAWKGDRLESGGRKVKALTLGEVKPVYLERGPNDREGNWRSLELLVEVSLGRTGEAFEKTRLDELVPDHWDEFAWCYQEYERRGWTKRGAVDAKGESIIPDDAWALVRKAMPVHPDPDRESATTGNTTIISHMRKAKSVLGPESRDSYLKPLRERFPDCLMKWWSTKINITVPDNRFSLSPDVYARMWGELPKLKQHDPQAWALIRLHWTTGVRPIEARHARESWLEQSADGLVLLVIKNRPAEGFCMKDRTTKQERPWPLAVDLLELLPSLVSAGGNLLGCDLEGQWDRVYRAASAWLREMGVEGTQTLYNLRKLVGTVKRRTEGKEAAADALGHSTSQTTEGSYTGTSAAIKALSDEDLRPESVMGLQRQPFKLARAA